MHIYIDEAGRWPLAWPVYVGLIFCQEEQYTQKLFAIYKDSKKLSEKQRNILFDQLQSSTIIWSYGSSTAAYIDAYGIVSAIRNAIIKWIKKLLPDAKNQNITLHIDGNTDFGLRKKFPKRSIHTYIKWDDKISAISAASIIAKVSRDTEMVRMDKKYPPYWFTSHKWYGTQSHRDAIKQYWLSKIHRKTFCKNIDIL